ncbi:MAG: hypothetical protein RL026_939 [Pseudomonadota bacterium]
MRLAGTHALAQRDGMRPVLFHLLVILLLLPGSALAQETAPETPFPMPRRSLRWINPGENGMIAARGSYTNERGQLHVASRAGAVDIEGHPFFVPLGASARACVSCHQPQDAMGLSLDSIRRQWLVTGGQDPIFETSDGADCDDRPAGVVASHSLLLDRGLFRVALPWPPRDATGRAVAAEFTLRVLRDPTRCNGPSRLGPKAKDPRVSVYRRPRPSANLTYTAQSTDDAGVTRNLMADARAPSLAAQAADAAATHMAVRGALPEAVLQQIVDFESALFVAQGVDRREGRLAGEASPVPALLGVDAAMAGGLSTVQPRASAQPQSAIARGHDLFHFRRIRPEGSCASCHDDALSGLHRAGDGVDLGLSNVANAAQADPRLPLFRIECRAGTAHPTRGRVILTQDPGRALVTGRCADVGGIVVPPLRGLAARAPYFSSGSAASLEDVVAWHDRHFAMGLSAQERADLVAYLGAL